MDKEQLDSIQQVIADIPGHVYIKDLTGRIIASSNQQARFLGYDSPADLNGKTDFDITTSEVAKQIQELDQAVIKTNKLETKEEILEDKDGTLIPFISSKKPFKDDSGVAIGVVGTSFDLSAQKKIQKLEQELAVAKERARVAELMASGIAHEMRTPISRISMQAERLEALVGASNNTEVAEIPKVIHKTLEQSRFVIDMLLMKSKIGKTQLKPFRSVSISQTILDAVNVYPFKANERDLLKFKLEDDFSFMGDPSYFQYLIFNLLKNAIFAVQKARKGKIKLSLNSKLKQFIFEDTGCGIPANILPKIFDEFYTQSAHGTGVGLALCRQIMRDFDGTIECESIEGEFTKFIMKF